MKIEYFAETDTLYISLAEGESVESEELSTGVVADYDAQGRVLGFELDSASRVTDAQSLQTNLKVSALAASQRRR